MFVFEKRMAKEDKGVELRFLEFCLFLISHSGPENLPGFSRLASFVC